MYNLRYHIASLVSVFLALALGLVLGGLAVGQGAVDRQEGALVEGLQKEFAQLREENSLLADENDLLNAFTTDSIDAWATDRLEGRTVVILTSTGRTDGVVDAREAVQGAGGEVATVTLLKPRFGLDDEDTASRIGTLAASPNAEETVAASLAAEWAAPGPRPVTEQLVDAGVLRVDGLPADLGAGGLVNVAASEEAPDAGAIAIARAFSSPSSVAVGAETPGSHTRVAAAAADAGLSALDTLGTQVGRYALIALLSGGEPGYYGTGNGVDAPYPPLTTP